MFKHIDTARSVAASLDRDWLEVLKLCIPKIVVFILPQFAASRSGETSNDQVKKRTAHATACYDLLAEQATKEVTALFIFFFNVRYMYKVGNEVYWIVFTSYNKQSSYNKLSIIALFRFLSSLYKSLDI